MFLAWQGTSPRLAPALWHNTFLLYKPLSLGYFVVASLEINTALEERETLRMTLQINLTQTQLTLCRWFFLQWPHLCLWWPRRVQGGSFQTSPSLEQVKGRAWLKVRIPFAWKDQVGIVLAHLEVDAIQYVYWHPCTDGKHHYIDLFIFSYKLNIRYRFRPMVTPNSSQ